MMMTNVTGVSIDDVRIGMPVECYVVKVEADLGLPFWRPVLGLPDDIRVGKGVPFSELAGQ